jgi:hypothetical protein
MERPLRSKPELCFGLTQHKSREGRGFPVVAFRNRSRCLPGHRLLGANPTSSARDEIDMVDPTWTLALAQRQPAML